MKCEDFYQQIGIAKNKSLQEYIPSKKIRAKPEFRLVEPNQEYADISGLNLYRVEYNNRWTNVWAFNQQSAKRYVIENFCMFDEFIIFHKVKLLVQPTKTENGGNNNG